MTSLYLEDLVPGTVYRTASAVMSAEEIVRFASEWDPQPFHLDREAAGKSFFGGLVASGFHTLVLTFKLYNDLGLFRDSAVAGVGLEGLRWLRPAKEGITVKATATVVDARPTRRPEHGRVTMRLESFTEDGQQLLTADLTILLLTRAAAASG